MQSNSSPKTEEQKQNIVLNIRTTNSTYIMYWHKMCTDVAIAIASVMVGVGAFAFTRPTLPLNAKIGIVGLFLLLLLGHGALAFYASRIIEQVRLILRKADSYDSLFSNDTYIAGDTLYPLEWANEADAISMRSLPFACWIALFIISSSITVFLWII